MKKNTTKQCRNKGKTSKHNEKNTITKCRNNEKHQKTM
jgi:hypothetical protein